MRVIPSLTVIGIAYHYAVKEESVQKESTRLTMGRAAIASLNTPGTLLIRYHT